MSEPGSQSVEKTVAKHISAYNRTGGADRGCPYCGDRKALKGYNDLRTTHPKIAREWNKERNGDLKPTDVIASSNKRVWWKCKEGHEWSGLIANRARKGKADPGCPYCSGRKVLAGYNDLVATHVCGSVKVDTSAYLIRA